MAPPSIRRIVWAVLHLCAAVSTADAQSIAASLSNYEAVLRVSSVAGIPAKSLSGMAFHPETKTLYVVDNDNAVVYELNASGTLLRSISTSGFLDPEGIAYQSDDFFFIAEEGLANIVRVKLPRSGNGPVTRTSGVAFNIAPNQANSGIEGISYCHANRTAYAVKEIDPPRLYRITLDAAGNPSASHPNEPFNIEGKNGDAADIYALNDGNFIIVNQEMNKLEGYGPQGQALSSLPLGMSKPEGMTIDTANGTIYVVGEPLEFSVFRKANTQARKGIPSNNGFSSSLVSGPTSDVAPVLHFSLPYRTAVRIDLATLDGDWVEEFNAMADRGDHVHKLGRPVRASGIDLCRFSAGSYQRIIKIVSFQQ